MKNTLIRIFTAVICISILAGMFVCFPAAVPIEAAGNASETGTYDWAGILSEFIRGPLSEEEVKGYPRIGDAYAEPEKLFIGTSGTIPDNIRSLFVEKIDTIRSEYTADGISEEDFPTGEEFIEGLERTLEAGYFFDLNLGPDPESGRGYRSQTAIIRDYGGEFRIVTYSTYYTYSVPCPGDDADLTTAKYRENCERLIPSVGGVSVSFETDIPAELSVIMTEEETGKLESERMTPIGAYEKKDGELLENCCAVRYKEGYFILYYKTRPCADTFPAQNPVPVPDRMNSGNYGSYPNGQIFSDVHSDDYFFQPVRWATDYKITEGTGADTFSPDSTCTRAQIVTFLWRAKGCPEPTGSVNPFSDVKDTDYFCKAVLWAVENNITKGTSKTTFSPDSGCTRGQAVTFLWRSDGMPSSKSSDNPFSDINAGEYYAEAVLWAAGRGITRGTSATEFSPVSTCTRAQIVTFLYRNCN